MCLPPFMYSTNQLDDLATLANLFYNSFVFQPQINDILNSNNDSILRFLSCTKFIQEDLQAYKMATLLNSIKNLYNVRQAYIYTFKFCYLQKNPHKTLRFQPVLCKRLELLILKAVNRLIPICQICTVAKNLHLILNKLIVGTVRYTTRY